MKIYTAEMSNGRTITIGTQSDATNFLEAMFKQKEKQMIITKGGIINPSFLVDITSKNVSEGEVGKIELENFEKESLEYTQIANGSSNKKLN